MLNKAYYSKTLLITISLGSLALTTSGTAMAGFEWVPGTPSTPSKQNHETIQVQKAPVPQVSNQDIASPVPPVSGKPAEQTEIIHISPAETSNESAGNIMTPSPFDTVETPEAEHTEASTAEPKAVIKTIDFTKAAPEQVKEERVTNETIEQLETQNLRKTEEVVDLPSASPTDLKETKTPLKQNVQNEIIPAVEQPQQLAPLPKNEEKAQKRLVIDTHPEKPAKSVMSNVEKPSEEVVYADAMGFGKDMPLALAVQQILPPGFAYSFAKSVNPGTRVSWNGGKQWNLVLLETLEPLDLSIRIDGKTVAIIRANEQKGTVTKQQNDSEIKEEDKQANAEILSIEPASGTEKPINSKASTTTNRLIIRDPGEKATHQPALGQPTPLEPGSQQNEALIVPLEDDNKISDRNKIVKSQYSWSAQKGESLKKVLYDWAKKADVQIVWEASHDYILNVDFSSSASAETAMKNLIETALKKDAIPSFRMLNTDMSSNQMALVIVQDKPKTDDISEENLTAG